MTTRRDASGWTRRDVLALGATAAGLTLATVMRGVGRAAPATVTGTTTATIEALRALVLQRAVTSEDPWVAMHVVLALGADARSPAGPLLDRVLAQHATKIERGGRTWVGFPLNVEA